MKQQILTRVIFLNIILVIAEIIAGIYSQSMALLADAFHNLGDVLALFISLIAIVYGAKKSNDTMTFGYIKAEMMAAFINSMFLIVTMIFILFESITRFFEPTKIDAPIVIFASLIALIVNGFSAWLLSKNHLNHNHEHKDLNVTSAYLHMFGDAVISLSVVVGGLIIYFFDIVMIDTILSIIFSIYIIKESLGVLKESFLSLMDSNGDNLNEIKELIINNENKILSLHDLHLYRPNSKEIYGSVHIVFNDDLKLSEIEFIIENIRNRLYQKGITHFIIQPESQKYNKCEKADSCYTHIIAHQ